MAHEKPGPRLIDIAKDKSHSQWSDMVMELYKKGYSFRAGYCASGFRIDNVKTGE